MHEIASLLEDEEPTTIVNVTLIPDSNEPITDEDSEDEEDITGRGMDISHLGRGLLSQEGELDFLNNDDDDLPDGTADATANMNEMVEGETREEEEVEDVEMEGEVEVQEELDRARRKRKTIGEQPVPQLSRIKNADRQWYQEKTDEYGHNIPAFETTPARVQVPPECHLPYDFLRLFLTDEYVDNIAVKSQLYCVRKGHPEKQSTMSRDGLLTSMGVMYLTGYLCPAMRSMFWQDRVDTQNIFVKKAISRNRFVDTINFTYFTDEEDVNPGDAFWKVRPIFDHLNSRAKDLIDQPEWVCVDESMIRYFGPHPLKQSIREKPER